VLLLLGFTLSSSLAGQIGTSRWWLLAAGLGFSVLLPVLLASWVRALRRGRGARTTRPSSLQAIALVNALLLLGAGLLAPGTTRVALGRHGSWWVEAISRGLGGDPKNAAVRGTGEVLRWLGALLPGQGEAGPALTASDGGTARRGDGGPAQPPGAADAGRPPDLRALPRDATAMVGGEVRVSFERRGSGVVVPVSLQGPGGRVEAKMLFDTGASFTTLNEATLRRLGLVVAPEDPTIETQTANGLVRRSLVVIDGVSVGRATVDGGVAVAACDPCASGEVVGLLGLNFSGHFRFTLDHAAGQLVLAARQGPIDHLADILPFVDLSEAKGSWRGPLLTVDVTVRSRAPRGLRDVKVAAVVKAEGREGRISGEAKQVPARGSTLLKLQGLPPVRAPSFTLRLESAAW